MKPKTISASSLQNAQDCIAKFKHANLDYVREVGKKEPAKMGSAIHYACEHFVRLVYIKKTEKWENFELFKQLYDEGYADAFGTWDRRSKWYTDGWKLAEKWYKRTDLSGVQVLSVEEKRRTPIPSALYDRKKPSHQQDPRAAVVPLTYIWDRCDKYVHPVTGNKCIKVVDYKSQRKYMRTDDLKTKLQCQLYAMAAMIYFRDEKPDEIWVELDMLRYEPVSVRFTIEECVEIWKDLRRELQRILDIDERKRLERTLGPGCQYCPVSATCPELKKNIDAGGMMSLSLEEKVKLRVDLEHKTKTELNLIEQIDDFILAEAAEREEIEFQVGEDEVQLKMKSRRGLDQVLALRIMGVELYARYAPMTMGKYDELMKDEDILTPEQKEQMRGIVETKYGETIVVVARAGD